MTDTQITPTGSSHVEVALAVGLSGAFVGLAIVISPLVAAIVVLPTSIAVGGWRAHTVPRRSPHSLSVPVYAPTAVVNAPRVSDSSGTKSATTAA